MSTPEKVPLSCFFIDDTKDLAAPKELQGKSCDLTVFRSLREFRTSEVFKGQPVERKLYLDKGE